MGLFAPLFANAASYDLTNCGAGIVTMVSASKELTVLAADVKGVARSNIEKGPFDNMTYQCASSVSIQGGTVNGAGFCKFMDADGDYLVGQMTPVAPGKGKWTFLQGTGKWEGITGSGEYASVTRGKPIAAGTSQGCSRATGTYELKK